MSTVINGIRHEDVGRFLPEVLNFLKHQVAGHSHTEKSQIGLLKHSEGYVLKPLQLGEKGIREHGFYEGLSLLPSTSLTSSVRRFVPHYLGTIDVDLPFGSSKFLKLEDLVDGYDKPCIADVKIGRHTWDPLASEEKRAKEEKKYRGTRETFGFCIPGMRFYDVSSMKLVVYDRSYGLQLDKTSAVEALASYLNASHRNSSQIIEAFLIELEEIRHWFENQREYLFFATSLLFVYSANSVVPLNEQRNNNIGEVVDTGPNAVNNILLHVKGDVHPRRGLVTLKLIDFAHVFPAEGQRDDNFLFGLESLIKIFRDLKGREM